jgi:8-amino-7-oxononanoate synthase
VSGTRDPLRFLDETLTDLERRALLRRPRAHGDADGLVVLCSNDYLGYADLPVQGAGGSGASRLVCGDRQAHRDAEGALAAWLGAEAALLFPSGYAANVGALSALAGPGDLIVSDRLNHASIIDGCRLSRAEVVITDHLDVGAVEAALRDAGPRARRRWVVTESCFSMDGDSPDLRALRAACDRHDAALFVDEAHAVGVLGPRGAGLCAQSGVRADILVGTMGKALGLQGAFVCGSEALRLYLWNCARSFVFTTGVAPALAAAVPDRVARAMRDDLGRAAVASLAGEIRRTVAPLVGPASPVTTGAVGNTGSPIVPWVLGPPEVALAVARDLETRGVLVHAIRPPTVPEGGSRLRITARAGLAERDVRRALGVLEEVAGSWRARR